MKSKENSQKKTIVIKIGTSSLIKEEVKAGSNNEVVTSLNLRQISAIVEVCCKLKNLNHNVVLVSSGAVGSGRHCLNLSTPPKSLSSRQALAAIGQVHLMSKYESFFASLKCVCAQILLTYDTFRIREHYNNAENTFHELFKMGVIGIVNENDTVATQELRSENDTMAAMVGSMVEADYLFLLTDVDGLYTGNPKTDPTAKLVKFVDDLNEIESLLGSLELSAGSSWGTGGMAVKINAANLATSLGIQTTILSGMKIDSIVDIVQAGSDRSKMLTGTTFFPVREAPNKRKRWIRGLRCSGKLIVDDGAAKAVISRKDIYAVGIKSVEGNFPYMAAVKICNQSGVEVATALTNFSSKDLRSVLGKSPEEMKSLDVSSKGPVIFRKNLAVDFSKDSNENLARYEKRNNAAEHKNFVASFDDGDDDQE